MEQIKNNNTTSRYRKSITISEKSYKRLQEMFDTNKESGVFLAYIVEQAILQLYNNKDIQININLLNLKY